MSLRLGETLDPAPRSFIRLPQQVAPRVATADVRAELNLLLAARAAEEARIAAEIAEAERLALEAAARARSPLGRLKKLRRKISRRLWPRDRGASRPQKSNLLDVARLGLGQRQRVTFRRSRWTSVVRLTRPIASVEGDLVDGENGGRRRETEPLQLVLARQAGAQSRLATDGADAIALADFGIERPVRR